MSVHEANCGCEHQSCYFLRHPGEACRRAIKEASSVCHVTNTSNSTRTLCTNARLGANQCQIRFPVAQKPVGKMDVECRLLSYIPVV
jgi:hypothetical protein